MKKSGMIKKLSFYNYSRSLENVIQFLESVQKKIKFVDLNVDVEGNEIKVKLFGTRDLQILASEKIKELANQFLKEPNQNNLDPVI